jgi:hypothetical protein
MPILMADHWARHGEAVHGAHPLVDQPGGGERPEVFPLQATELGRREVGVERPLSVVDEARAAMPPCEAYLLPLRLGVISGDLPGGSEEVVLGHESEDQIKQGVPLVVPKYKMRALGTKGLECCLEQEKVR